MSRALASVTPTSGIVVAESIPGGSMIQRTRLPGSLASTPAMYMRPEIPLSGGPTVPSVWVVGAVKVERRPRGVAVAR